ncbi:hypothetical protein SAMN05216553_13024 [Lentzea fradiae]|uniref:Uncharacterized protein n=1 Tax=Lentzea fradiae TaxID=200378 RepID=A0A1G8DJJ5_9PSEU|nr:hypothetical protein SAMN05216553_13024 [Lentzea fradiae]
MNPNEIIHGLTDLVSVMPVSFWAIGMSRVSCV